jgi:hypothetical protein
MYIAPDDAGMGVVGSSFLLTVLLSIKQMFVRSVNRSNTFGLWDDPSNVSTNGPPRLICSEHLIGDNGTLKFERHA